MRDTYDETNDALNPDNYAAPEYDSGSEHPSPEQMMIRNAVKYLTPKQRKVWQLHNYDRLTQDEIGAKLGISHQTVAEHIKACEARITKWCNSNPILYKMLKGQFNEPK